MNCPKGSGSGKGRSHFTDGLLGYGVWPCDGAGSAMFGGVSVNAEHYALEDRDAPLTLLDEDGVAIPDEVADQYRSNSERQTSARSLLEVYASSRWMQPAAPPTEDSDGDADNEAADAEHFDVSAGTSVPTTRSGA